MGCDDLQALIDLYLDGELDEVDCAEIETHASGCEACGAVLARQSEFKQGLKSLGSEYALDDGFRARLGAALDQAPAPVAAPMHEGWKRLAAAALAVVGLSAGLLGVAAQSGDEASAASVSPRESATSPVSAEMVDESVRWHSRPLPVDVTGPDGAAVADWFRSRVDFPVAPPDFARRAHLLGGRVGNVQQSEAAYLVYDVDGRKLSVMMFDAHGAPVQTAHRPDGTPVPFYVGERNGYNVAVHEQDGVGYTFTSDLSDWELVDLVSVAFSY